MTEQKFSSQQIGKIERTSHQIASKTHLFQSQKKKLLKSKQLF